MERFVAWLIIGERKNVTDGVFCCMVTRGENGKMRQPACFATCPDSMINSIYRLHFPSLVPSFANTTRKGGC